MVHGYSVGDFQVTATLVSTVESTGKNRDNAFLRYNLRWLRGLLYRFSVVIDIGIVIYRLGASSIHGISSWKGGSANNKRRHNRD